jgi:alanine racemase
MIRHSSRIELSRAAFRNNLSFLRERIGPHPTLSLVVKANAYGHGITPIVRLAQSSGLHHFSVASSLEASIVHAAMSQDGTIMIMGILYDEDLPWVVENDIEFFVYDLERLQHAANVGREVGKQARIHLEIETGGNRTGLPLTDLSEALRIFQRNRRSLQWSGLCTHLAGAESLANEFRINKQLARFEEVAARLRKRQNGPGMYHVASSAAALSKPDTALDLVRVGVAAYGFWPSPEIRNLYRMHTERMRENRLQRVLTWRTDIMHIKNIKEDEFVGYGTSFQAPRDMRIAVIPVGYANGYPREMSNRGNVLIHGRRAPVIGKVNMNLFMVDVSAIPQAEVGDEVTLVGRQKNNVIPISSFAEMTSALNTEFACRLPDSIPRTLVR